MLYMVLIDFEKLSFVNLRQPKFKLHVKVLYSIIYLVIVRAFSCTAIFYENSFYARQGNGFGFFIVLIPYSYVQQKHDLYSILSEYV